MDGSNQQGGYVFTLNEWKFMAIDPVSIYRRYLRGIVLKAHFLFVKIITNSYTMITKFVI